MRNSARKHAHELTEVELGHNHAFVAGEHLAEVSMEWMQMGDVYVRYRRTFIV